jgi:hypothetical protein
VIASTPSPFSTRTCSRISLPFESDDASRRSG